MRALSVVVAAAVMGSASLLSAAPASAAGSGLTSLSVEVHEIPSPNTATAIDWQIDDTWRGGDIEVDLYSEALGDHVTVSWSVGTGAGQYEVPGDLLGEGIYYAESARIVDGRTESYRLYEDAPLLDDVWFANEVDAPPVPNAPEVTLDTMPGPELGEIAVVCTESSGFGLPILEYQLVATPVGGGTPVVHKRNGWSRCSDVIGGLTPGQHYDITATARTAVGESEQSNVVTDEALAGPPDAPSELTAVPGDQSAQLSWARPDSSGYRIDQYAVEIDCDGWHEELVQAEAGVDAPGTVTATGLTNGCQGTFRVAAHTAKGWSQVSGWSEVFVPTSGQTPSAPASLSASWSAQNTLRAAWAWTDLPEGDEPTNYEVEVSQDGEVVASAETSCCTWSSSADLDSRLAHSVRVRAENSAGWSEWSPAVEVSGVPAPGEVVDPVVFGRFGGAYVAWSAPSSGVPGGGYRYTVSEGRDVDALAPEIETDAVSARITDLTPGHDYVVSVWAVNEFGEEGARSTMLVEGTELRLRQPTEPTRVKSLTDVSGRVFTTVDGEPVAGGTVHLQRLRADGSGYRSLDVWADTGPRGRFSLSYRPKADVQYRVALVGNAGLGGSAAVLPVVA